MRRAALPAALLALLYIAFGAGLLYAARHLPEIVATHFRADGAPNGWDERAALLRTHGLAALFLPLGTVALCYAIRYFPDGYQNIPRPHYWLAPQRRAWYFAWLVRRALWFAVLALAYVGAQFALTLAANRGIDARFPMAAMWTVTALFLVATIAWFMLLLRFLRKERMPESD